jgi:hypothetical protein
MSVGLLESGMTTKRKDVAVKIDVEVIAEAKMVAASRGVTLAEYLSDMLRPIVRRDLQGETSKRLQDKKPTRRGKTEGAGE